MLHFCACAAERIAQTTQNTLKSPKFYFRGKVEVDVYKRSRYIFADTRKYGEIWLGQYALARPPFQRVCACARVPVHRCHHRSFGRLLFGRSVGRCRSRQIDHSLVFSPPLYAAIHSDPQVFCYC